jgi:hypothetical protein
MDQIELWTWFGRQLSNRRRAERLKELLCRVPPGTALEGDWLPALGVYFVSDITFIAQRTIHQGRSRVEFTRPVRPENAGIEILDYPPDDWRLELFLNSDKVVVVSQHDQGMSAVDLRSHGYEEKVRLMKDIVARIDHPEVRMLPAADLDFHQAYEEWKLHDYAEGVVIKHRQSKYPSRRHLYEWD